MYAIIEHAGHQYKISPKDLFDTEKIPYKEEEVFEVDKVLLLTDKDNTEIGQPYLPKTKVKLKVVKHFKGKKIRVSRFKAKSRYSKVSGFRPSLSRLRVESIESGLT